ncbi:hypothetical protein BCA33_13850 [Marinobacter sp. AC-23]|nr:hypothetical protein BCA33_13850 [Marinobacter sp. AC-23]
MNIILCAFFAGRLCAIKHIGKTIQAVAKYGCLARRKTVKLADMTQEAVIASKCPPARLCYILLPAPDAGDCP